MYLNGFCIRFDSPDEIGKETCRRLVCNEDIKTHLSDVHICVPAMLSHDDYQKHSRSVVLYPELFPTAMRWPLKNGSYAPLLFFPLHNISHRFRSPRDIQPLIDYPETSRHSSRRD